MGRVSAHGSGDASGWRSELFACAPARRVLRQRELTDAIFGRSNSMMLAMDSVAANAVQVTGFTERNVEVARGSYRDLLEVTERMKIRSVNSC
jgi:hypothetical protein